MVLFDETGDIEERYEYDAYGKAVILESDFDIRASSLYDNPYLFTGRRLDILDGSSLKLQYSRARYYDTKTGRFLQRDPLEYVDGMNLYEYVLSNPIVNCDAYGESVDSSWGEPTPKGKNCIDGCYMHCYHKFTHSSYTITLASNYLLKGKKWEIIKIIIEEMAKGSGPGFATADTAAYAVLVTEVTTIHDYGHWNCKTREEYGESSKYVEEDSYSKEGDVVVAVNSGNVNKSMKKDAIKALIPSKTDRGSWINGNWEGFKIDTYQFCKTNNDKDYEFPDESWGP